MNIAISAPEEDINAALGHLEAALALLTRVGSIPTAITGIGTSTDACRAILDNISQFAAKPAPAPSARAKRQAQEIVEDALAWIISEQASIAAQATAARFKLDQAVTTPRASKARSVAMDEASMAMFEVSLGWARFRYITAPIAERMLEAKLGRLVPHSRAELEQFRRRLDAIAEPVVILSTEFLAKHDDVLAARQSGRAFERHNLG